MDTPDSISQPSTTQAALRALKSRGLRASASRRMIIQILLDAVVPLSAREIAAGPDGAHIGLDLASVYRNLDILERNGLVHQIHPGQGPGRYVSVGAAEHEYLACERCGAIVELDPRELEDLRAEVEGRFGYEVSFRHVPMVGHCRECR
jgi:Fur family transcriptional regulator, ferric uptake regulator